MARAVSDRHELPLRVVFAIANLEGGGAQRVFTTLLRHLDRSRIEPIVVLSCREGPFVGDLPSDVAVYDLDRKRSWDLPLLAARLQRLLRAHRVDAIVGFLWHANVLAILSSRLGRARPKIVVTEHICGAYADAADGIVRRKTARWLFPLADHAVAVSAGVRDDILRRYALPGGRVTVIPNPIDLDEVARKSAEPVNGGWPRGEAPVIVAVGRLVNRQKGFDVLLRAVARIPGDRKWRVVLIGDGEDRVALGALARELRIADRVHFLGFQANPFKFMARSDIFALPSRAEGFGCVLVEAMAVGLPIVSTDCPHGPREIIEHGATGLLVPPDDEIKLAEAFETLLADRGTRDKLRSAARVRAQDYGAPKVAARYADLIRGLV